MISLVKDKYLNNLFIRTLLSLILLILVNILIKYNTFYNMIYQSIYSYQIDYAYIRSKTKYIIGNILGNKDKYVSSNKLLYKSIEEYGNGYKLITDFHYVINAIKPGTVIFIGTKEDLGQTVIIESESGICYWYSSIENISVNLYDYIDTSTIIGSTKEDYLIITLSKDNEYLTYEENI